MITGRVRSTSPPGFGEIEGNSAEPPLPPGAYLYQGGRPFEWTDTTRTDRGLAMAVPAARQRDPGARRLSWAAARSPSADDDIFVTELYRQYRMPLLAYVLRLTGGDRQLAEDVVQEAMVRAWRQADQLDRNAPSLMPWLATVARRIVIDTSRRGKARPTETGDSMLENVPVDDTTEELLRKMVVAEALQTLSPAHREVLNETILRDRTVNEAAEILGIPPGTVKSRVYYALKALRLVLAERGVSV
jgi:RNA polymerase sigma-70 factor (ECF subfamily)